MFIVTAANGQKLLLEAGVVWSKLRKSLDFDLSGFVGCFCTHEHKDHSKAISDVMQAGIDVYALPDVFESQDMDGHRRAVCITPGQTIKVDCFQVFVFELVHDVPIVGFVVYCDGEYLLFCTDTYYPMRKEKDGTLIIHEFKYPFSIIAIEASFDKDILQKRVDTNDIHESLAKRLWTSHLEKDNALGYVREKCLLSKCREIHLLHMSGDNLDKSKTIKEFRDELFIKTISVGMK